MDNKELVERDGIVTDIREYFEEYPVTIYKNENDRWVVYAKNEGGYNSVEIDLEDILETVEHLKNVRIIEDKI
jgi:hypothetical protein